MAAGSREVSSCKRHLHPWHDFYLFDWWSNIPKFFNVLFIFDLFFTQNKINYEKQYFQLISKCPDLSRNFPNCVAHIVHYSPFDISLNDQNRENVSFVNIFEKKCDNKYYPSWFSRAPQCFALIGYLVSQKKKNIFVPILVIPNHQALYITILSPNRWTECRWSIRLYNRHTFQ